VVSPVRFCGKYATNNHPAVDKTAAGYFLIDIYPKLLNIGLKKIFI
jgi:hypothetical protein